MSTPRGNGQNGGHYYSNITQPVRLEMSFVVDATNGLGITSLKSNGYVRNVFMHTSTTPAANDGYTNPNPPSGYALIQLKNNFNVSLGAQMSIQPPTTGSALTSTTANLVYVINALGTTTTAQWQAKGLPVGLTPAVGQSFVATATGAIGGTGSVKVPGVSGVQSMELVGDPSASSASSPIATAGGAWLMVKFMGPTDASTTTPIPVAPTALSVIRLSVINDISSVTIDGL